MVVGLGEPQALGIEAGGVGGERVAAAGVVGLDRLVGARERHGLELHLVGAEIVREIELGGGALLHADGGVVELERRIHLQRLAHQEALAVVIVDRREVQAERGVARGGPGGVARQHVDVAGLQRGEAVLRGQRDELHLGRIVEDRGRERAAEIDIEAGPVALRVGQAETAERAVGAAIDHAARLDGVERLGRCRRGGNSNRRREGELGYGAFHDFLQSRGNFWAAVAGAKNGRMPPIAQGSRAFARRKS